MALDEGVEAMNMSDDRVPFAFQELWITAQHLINPPPEERRERLHAVPISLRRAADLIESDPVYHRFVESSPWQPRASAWRLGEVLRRVGFYQAVQRDRKSVV